jgi:hypothetical protein
MSKIIRILGGGTFSHVRNHLALSAPAFGETARKLDLLFYEALGGHSDHKPGIPTVQLHLTRMANPTDKQAAVTNDHVAGMLDRFITDPNTRVIIMNAALCDFNGYVAGAESDKYADRLHSRDIKPMSFDSAVLLTAAPKLVGRIREHRKDIFAVAFKTTTGATPDEQYLAGLNLLKQNSLNLVLANDTVTRHNMIIAPEETRYFETDDREEVLRGLVQMVLARMDNTFTRSTVIGGKLVSFQDDERVPANLRQVVNHLVERGAYKPFNGSTAGHFAVRLDDEHCLTSRRKTNYTQKGGLDLVKVEYDGLNMVIAQGAKPSVGGQSQRIVFTEHPDLDCIVHAHVPLRADAPDDIPVAPQWQNECGSHQCGANTSRNLKAFPHGIHAVMLEGHGPNIVFSKETRAEDVIDFIERNFDLTDKTGGLVEPAQVAYA